MEVYRTPDLGVIAYTAGIIDGEGTIMRKYNPSGSPSVSMCQSDKNKGEYLCNWLRNEWRIGRITRREGANNLSNHYITWSWIIQARRDVLWILKLITPFLIVKQERAIIVISDIEKSIDDKQRWTIWTESEDKYLVENYQRLTIEQLSETLNRSSDSIMNRGRFLGLTREGGRGWRSYNQVINGWMPEEDEFLRQHYGHIFAADIAKKLNRTLGSVEARAKRLGITRGWGERRKLNRL